MRRRPSSPHVYRQPPPVEDSMAWCGCASGATRSESSVGWAFGRCAEKGFVLGWPGCKLGLFRPSSTSRVTLTLAVVVQNNSLI
jgi:hypothetical protein